VLFPEATTSNGERVLDFKSSLMDPARKSGVRILPLCIKYKALNGEKLCASNRDSVFYYGDADFFTHLIGVMKLKSIEVEIAILNEVDTSVNKSRKEITSSVYNSISSAYSLL